MLRRKPITSTIGPIAPSGISGGSFGSVGSFGVVVGIPVLWSSQPTTLVKVPGRRRRPGGRGAAPLPGRQRAERADERAQVPDGRMVDRLQAHGGLRDRPPPADEPAAPALQPREVLLEPLEGRPEPRPDPAERACEHGEHPPQQLRDRVGPAQQADHDLDRLPEGEGDHRPEVEHEPADRDEAQPQRLEEDADAGDEHGERAEQGRGQAPPCGRRGSAAPGAAGCAPPRAVR